MNELFLKILNMSIAASWLVLALLILRTTVLKKTPKWIIVLLWGLVAIRLLCPLTIKSALSLIPSADTIPLDIEMATKPTIDSGISLINEAVNPLLSSFAPSQDALTSANPLQIWIPFATIIWLIGIVAFLIYMVFSYWRLHKTVATAVLYQENIYLSENVCSAFVAGIIKPRIYLPFNVNERDLKAIVAHEKAHIQRKDHWWKLLGYFLLAIYWFNPLMWLAYHLLLRDIELACDERAIKDFNNEQRADYAQALLTCSVNHHLPASCPLAFGEVGVKERVRSVMNHRRPTFWLVVLSLTICFLMAVCFLPDPKKDRYTLAIKVPPGGANAYYYSEEEICTTGKTIIISTGKGLGDCEVILVSSSGQKEPPTYLTPGMSTTLAALNKVWYRVGVRLQNPSEKELIVYVEVKNVDVRIPENAAENINQVGMPLMKAVMIEGKLYYETGQLNKSLTCGTMDGVITSEVSGDKLPVLNDQSNFGTGNGYQFGPAGTVTILIDDQYLIFQDAKTSKEHS